MIKQKEQPAMRQYCACGCGQAFEPQSRRKYYSEQCGYRLRARRQRGKARSVEYKVNVSHPRYQPLEKRFWEKVEKTNECWLWKGKPDKHYGKIGVDGKAKLAHRVSYELAYGSIPESTRVSHSCNNPLCVRPDHLFCTTPLTVLWWSAITLLDEKARYLL